MKSLEKKVWKIKIVFIWRGFWLPGGKTVLKKKIDAYLP